jgi:hypothetical protein
MGNISLKEQLNQLPPELKGIIRKYTINICISCQNKYISDYELQRFHQQHFPFTCLVCRIQKNMKNSKVKYMLGIN